MRARRPTERIEAKSAVTRAWAPLVAIRDQGGRGARFCLAGRGLGATGGPGAERAPASLDGSGCMRPSGAHPQALWGWDT